MSPVLPPLQPGLPYLGSTRPFFHDRLRFLRELSDSGNPVVRFRLLGSELYFLNHPAAIQQVLHYRAENYLRPTSRQARELFGEGLLTSEGPSHAFQRELLHPAFHQSGLATYSPTITQPTVTKLEHWKRIAAEGHPVDLLQELDSLMVEIVCRTFFSTDPEVATRLANAFSRLNTCVSSIFGSVFQTLAFRLHLPISTRREFLRLIELFEGEVGTMIAQARDPARASPVLISRLLDQEGAQKDQQVLLKLVRDEVLTLLFAGMETTSDLLGWTFHLLTTHPDEYARLQEEISQTLAGQLPQSADLRRLPYLGHILDEALRLYPPVWAISRRASAADSIRGYSIPAHAEVLISPFTIQRHPAWWEKPNQFDPGRWTPERLKGRAAMTYLPFGAGKHRCIGMHFARMVAALVVASVTQHFLFAGVEGQNVVPQPLVTLRPGGLRMTIAAQSHNPGARLCDCY